MLNSIEEVRNLSEWENMKRQFVDPPAEFTPMPFWFWNDELSREEIIRQIHDFHAHEVDGFVLHPRMGLPRALPYLSDSYFDLVEAAVAEAAKLGMRVILYDEGMYPSGSACGKVVERNPEFASRGLRMEEHPCRTGRGAVMQVPVALSPGESLVSALAVRKLSDKAIEAASALVLERGSDSGVSFTQPDAGDWSVLLFIDTYSRGTIRGVHPGQDDGEPDAPLAADLLNPEAVQAFIDLTHEAYYRKLSRYFGTTVLAMFTDEPDLLGRGHAAGMKPWTRGFMGEYLAGGGREQDLPLLWFDAEDALSTTHVRDAYGAAIRGRLSRAYYKPLADWCEAHGIGLTGHPAGSDDIGLLEHFHIPGQDVVWRYIAPEDGKSLTGAHSTMGKCSSDAARHRGRRRNLNECFGVCGIGHGWMLSADNMKWYLDWLFVRGVNLVSPHAFYYSIRGERRDERPPDVGPNNIWWPEYSRFSRYIKRMSWLMTDSANGAEIAVLARADDLPWRVVKPLYEQQIEFNYLEESLLRDACGCKDGALEIAGYRYSAVLVENGERLNASSWGRLEEFVGQGGLVVELSEEGKAATIDIGQVRFDRAENAAAALAGIYGRDTAIEPHSAALRISRVTKNGMLFYVIVNEGEAGYEGVMRLKSAGRAEYWRPWTGECVPANVDRIGDGQSVAIRVERRECLIVAVDPGDVGTGDGGMPAGLARTKSTVAELSEGWRVVDGPQAGESPLSALTSWTDWPEMALYSGTVTYENSFELDDPARWTGIRLDLGEAHELVRLRVNGREAGVRMWRPYVFDLGPELRQGTNRLRVEVTNSLANRYDGKPWPSGLIGPVRLSMQSERK